MSFSDKPYHARFIQYFFLFTFAFAYSQNSITVTFTELANQQIKLVGYNGFDTYTIDSTQANEKGRFKLSFGTEDFGMAYLLSEDEKSLVVILADNENLQLKGDNIAVPETIVIKKGTQNQLFEQYSVSQLDSWIDWYLVQGNK